MPKRSRLKNNLTNPNGFKTQSPRTHPAAIDHGSTPIVEHLADFSGWQPIATNKAALGDISRARTLRHH